MFKRVLIANRGEIAVRIIRACHELGIKTVAVYSSADANSLAVEIATHSICIGAGPARESYLNAQAILSVAKGYNCDAIHPGYGFLSENEDFVRLCEEQGIIFIGPSADVISKMGNKASARRIMQYSGVPVVPGSDGTVDDETEAEIVALRVGYPVLIKASAGGGGRGMRIANNSHELRTRFGEAKQEAIACFGDGSLYIEKLIINPRHIEVQILGDSFQNVVHLGERECSIQRKNQKLLEESPAKGLSTEIRECMGADAVAAAKAVGYCGAGTVEFVMDAHQNYYFIEMNTRIQVEHPVTEMVTGRDIVCAQLKIAAGLPLGFEQKDVYLNGHAIECRINAEDVTKNFVGTPGVTKFLHLPAGCGVRVDSALYSGYELSPYYDSLVAKIIVHAPTRLQAIRRMRRALEELVIEGYPTTAEFLHLILHQPDFVRGRYDTGYLNKYMDDLLKWSKT